MNIIWKKHYWILPTNSQYLVSLKTTFPYWLETNKIDFFIMYIFYNNNHQRQYFMFVMLQRLSHQCFRRICWRSCAVKEEKRYTNLASDLSRVEHVLDTFCINTILVKMWETKAQSGKTNENKTNGLNKQNNWHIFDMQCLSIVCKTLEVI